jgi:pimeloyl-ACP methyl ester carboxylesterase
MPVTFDVHGMRLLGMLDRPGPGRPERAVGVLMLNSDDGCRLGPHRLWVRLAAALCERGFPCLRFDYRGCGDSEGPDESPTADVALADALAAASLLQDRTGVRAIVLVGICYGAEVALLAGECLDSAVGVVACSTGRYVTAAGYEESLADAWRYVQGYGRKLLSRDAWRRILTGRVHAAVVVGGLWRRLSPEHCRRDRQGAEAAQVRAAGQGRRVPSLFIYGTADPLTDKHMPGYQDEADGQRLDRRFHVVAGADHNYSSLPWSNELIREVVAFVQERCNWQERTQDAGSIA